MAPGYQAGCTRMRLAADRVARRPGRDLTLTGLGQRAPGGARFAVSRWDRRTATTQATGLLRPKIITPSVPKKWNSQISKLD